MPELYFDPAVSISGPEASEGQAITLRLDGVSASDVSVTARIIGATAFPQSDVDFNFYSSVDQIRTITIPAGDSSVRFYVEQNEQGGSEVDENYILELTDPVNATLSGGVDVLRVTGVIVEDGRSLFVSDPTILEGDSGQTYAEFEVRISRPSASTLTFNYQTLDGSAIAGQDYTAMSGSLSFVPGQEVTYIRVPVRGDAISEASETFHLAVNPTAATPFELFNGTEDNVGTALIRDDDGKAGTPVVTLETTNGPESSSGQVHAIRLSEPSNREVSVTVYVIGGTAMPQNDVDFDYYSSVDQVITVTVPAGETTVEFGIEQNVQGGSEVDENYILEVTDPVNATLAGGVDVLRETAVILEDGRSLFVSDPTVLEGDGAGYVEFEVRVSRPSTEPMVFTYETIDGSAIAGQDYMAVNGVLSFVPGQTVAYVRVPVSGDLTSEFSETFMLSVLPNEATEPLIFNGTDDNTGTAILRDDDGNPGTPVVSLEVTDGPESSGGQGHYLRLSEPSNRDVTVTIQIVAGTASPQSDVDFDFYSSVQQVKEYTIPAGETSVSVFVEHNQEGGSELDESYILEVTDPVNATLAGGVEALRATAVILGDGRALFVSDPTVREGDSGRSYAEFEVRVSQPAEVPLTFTARTFDVSAEAGEDYRAVTQSITLEPGQTTTYVRVPLIDDGLVETV